VGNIKKKYFEKASNFFLNFDHESIQPGIVKNNNQKFVQNRTKMHTV
jgi:hypothetical protein